MSNLYHDCLSRNSDQVPPDDASAAEILAHAQRMARGAANRLSMLKPNTDYAFLLQNEDGEFLLILFPTDLSSAMNNSNMLLINMILILILIVQVRQH